MEYTEFNIRKNDIINLINIKKNNNIIKKKLLRRNPKSIQNYSKAAYTMNKNKNKVISKDIGNISLDLSKEEEVMKNTPGLMENSMIENITAMNSIFEQKQSERLMLNNLNKLNINDSRSTDINNSNQTLKNLVGNDLSNSNDTKESPLDVAVIIKDSQEVIEEEKKKEKKIRISNIYKPSYVPLGSMAHRRKRFSSFLSKI